jgi:hypothetical protein
LIMKRSAFLVALFILLVTLPAAIAQEDPPLTLRLSRDFGLGLGSSIQGTFSYRVDAPDEVVDVSFLMDGKLLAESRQRPFRYQFKTDDFATGIHTMSAVGRTASGTELPSNTITRNFLAAGASRQFTVWIFGGVLVLIVSSWLVSFWASKRGKTGKTRGISGPVGTAVCPNCGKPFARHLWGLNLGVGKYDRCPHCHKWNLVRRASAVEIEVALKLLDGDDRATAVAPPHNDDEDLQNRLNDSRYDN